MCVHRSHAHYPQCTRTWEGGREGGREVGSIHIGGEHIGKGWEERENTTLTCTCMLYRHRSHTYCCVGG